MTRAHFIYKSCPKSSHMSFYAKSFGLKMLQNVTKYLGYFWRKYCCRELSQIAQSGHTEDQLPPILRIGIAYFALRALHLGKPGHFQTQLHICPSTKCTNGPIRHLCILIYSNLWADSLFGWNTFYLKIFSRCNLGIANLHSLSLVYELIVDVEHCF